MYLSVEDLLRGLWYFTHCQFSFLYFFLFLVHPYFPIPIHKYTFFDPSFLVHERNLLLLTLCLLQGNTLFCGKIISVSNFIAMVIFSENEFSYYSLGLRLPKATP